MTFMPALSEAWRDLCQDPEEVVRYLDLAAERLAELKRTSIEMMKLQPGSLALDVGCGLGRDAEIMLDAIGAGGRVTGVDLDPKLIAKAIERTQASPLRPSFEVGDILSLRFADNTFDGCRVDRVLQHLPDPSRAMAEMIRVTRPGGRLSILDLDWHTLILAGGDITISQELTRYIASVAVCHGDIGRRLVQLLISAGCGDIEIKPHVSLIRDLHTAAFVLQIRRALEALIAAKIVSRDAGEEWWQALEALDARGCFYASVDIVICAGTKPLDS
jgi:ubiquinone/menaquinone biosynthesis C-methylase UbiE